MTAEERQWMIDTALRVTARCSCGATWIVEASAVSEALAQARDLGVVVSTADVADKDAMAVGMLAGMVAAQAVTHLLENITHKAEVFVKP